MKFQKKTEFYKEEHQGVYWQSRGKKVFYWYSSLSYLQPEHQTITQLLSFLFCHSFTFQEAADPL